MRPRAQRPRLPETSARQRKARLAWNGGMTGESRPPAPVAPFEACPVTCCGTPADDQAPPGGGMVQVAGAADGADAHWYCPGRCTVLARTRAELRAVPVRPGGVR
ncbi:hypothetical protein [Streptomyces sp. NPDC001508]|uniref:hypothetical protein n=1 Tax=Streptomyces sp. NPDC001508 TaxID=3154656 RepID=UPI00332CC731